MVDLRGRDLLSVSDLSSDELSRILELTKTLKAERGHAKWKAALSGRTLAMLFMKPSTRTRVSFDVAMHELGGHSITLSPSETQLSRGETVSDTGRVLSRYVSGIMARVTSHSILVDLAQHSSVPVINGLSDLEHPCQAIGDVFTMLEKFGHLGGIGIAYLGDGNNVANSLILASALMGMSVTVATPVGFEPKQDIVATASRFAKASGGEVAVVKDPLKAVAGADIVYTDVWVSMGNEDETEARKRALAPYQVNDQVMRAASEDAIFLHCLPAHRGEEVTDDVMDGSQSAVWQQAENRMHAQKAILLSLIG